MKFAAIYFSIKILGDQNVCDCEGMGLSIKDLKSKSF